MGSETGSLPGKPVDLAGLLSDEVLINLCPLLNRSLAIVSVVMDVQSSCYGRTSLNVMDVYMIFALFKICRSRVSIVKT